MKTGLFIYLMMINFTAVLAQGDDNFAAVDAKAFSFPAVATHSTTAMAKHIQENFTGNKEKIRAAYRWVTANIQYDKDSMLSINWSKNTPDKIAATLRRKKGVCDNFASVFTDVLVKMNINSYVVHGHTNGSRNTSNAAHSWSAVQLDDKWFLCDPTWDAGYNGITRYFLISPQQFIDTHWPFDPLWQLLEYPISHKEFINGFAYAKKNNHYFNAQDSVKTFMELDSLQQLEAIARRMNTAGISDENLRTWYAYNQMNIAIIYGEQDMFLYNAAVADYNKASAYLNDFIRYRNVFFKPEKTAAEISAMLQPVDGLIAAAYKKIAGMGLVKENFQYDTGLLTERLKSLSKKGEEQNKFLKTYVETAAAHREKLFLQ